jgi:gliding motility-associated-like protein
VGGVTVPGEVNATFDVTHYVSTTTPTPALPLVITSTVTSAQLCTAPPHQITIDRIYCEIQNGISPNNDGKNDNFDLRSLNVQQLGIFNRYGTKVYVKADYIDEWVGQSNAGDELPDGTYYYVIEFKNNQPSKTGWIYINRENK